jgi:hypothetical protein
LEACVALTKPLQTAGESIMDRATALAIKPELTTATDCEVSSKETSGRFVSNMVRQLIEIHHEWVCSVCGHEFYNPGCVLTGLTLNEIMQHVKKMREQAFANHACFGHSA